MPNFYSIYPAWAGTHNMINYIITIPLHVNYSHLLEFFHMRTVFDTFSESLHPSVSNIIFTKTTCISQKRNNSDAMLCMDACHLNCVQEKKLTQVYSYQHSAWDWPQESESHYHQCCCLEDYYNNTISGSHHQIYWYIMSTTANFIMFCTCSRCSARARPVLPVYPYHDLG